MSSDWPIFTNLNKNKWQEESLPSSVFVQTQIHDQTYKYRLSDHVVISTVSNKLSIILPLRLAKTAWFNSSKLQTMNTILNKNNAKRNNNIYNNFLLNWNTNFYKLFLFKKLRLPKTKVKGAKPLCTLTLRKYASNFMPG